MTKHAMSHKILIIDDDHDILLTARMFLEQLEFDVTVMSDPAQVLTRLSNEDFDVVLLDMNFQRGRTEGIEGLQWLERIRQHDSDMVVILMTILAGTGRCVVVSRSLLRGGSCNSSVVREPGDQQPDHNQAPHYNDSQDLWPQPRVAIASGGM